ncbi:hypothetical protein L1049_022606 [Liquidambar formosana]|uniref:Uncharacterized protein n=1 Tax=Liquidambar formosana TaxID=63359 RepID=A0AAP0RE40_LIQFO
MDYSRQSRVSVADILRMNQDDDVQMGYVGTWKRAVGEMSKSSYRNRVLHCVISPVAMKRSFSSGRFLFNRHGRGRNATIPV